MAIFSRDFGASRPVPAGPFRTGLDRRRISGHQSLNRHVCGQISPYSGSFIAMLIFESIFARVVGMRVMIAVLLATASFLSPLQGYAASDDVEATIQTVSVDSLSLTLDDGKVYVVPEEFNFDGLQAGVKVVVFYTEVDGRRVVDDLEIVQ
jgi:hypothetical protein